MSERNLTDTRRELEQMSTRQLDDLLQMETAKAFPDDDRVLLILRILEEREKDLPLELTPGEQEAWERYKQKKLISREAKSGRARGWLSAAAVTAVVITLLFVIVPQNAQAESFWEMLQRWSKTVVEYFSREDQIVKEGYRFETDNPGLQQVYDAVVELGVTEPVVPMWLPEGYELLTLESKNTPMSQNIYAWFTDADNGAIVYKLDKYSGEPAHQFYRDESYSESYERNGVTYNITRNNDRWTVVYTKENIECLLTMDCREDTLRRVLESIYVMEDD